MSERFQLIIPGQLYARLEEHLFCGDGDEHGAVIAAGLARGPRGTRLLARELFVARDGIDFVPGKRAYRRLTPEFVSQHIRYCRDERLVYLAVHNHGGWDQVAFSGPDMASHERGYPALLDIARGMPVGALVFARGAVAGDIWLPGRVRHELAETLVLSHNIERLYPQPHARPSATAEIDDRQVRIWGAAGQALLAQTKVGVIGAGGVGLPIIAHLARMGVGHIVAVDPDRVQISNLPRLPEARGRDAASWLTAESRPERLRRLGRRLAVPKVRLAARVVRHARRDVRLEAVFGDVADGAVARMLSDCDYLFNAANSHQARAVFNALVHAYLIPGVQVGSLVTAQSASGRIRDVFSVLRPAWPDSGCLLCNGVINPGALQRESLDDTERRAQNYGLDAADGPAPSVMALNTAGVGAAVTDFMLAVTGLRRETEHAHDYRRYEARSATLTFELPRRSPDCLDCGPGEASLRARGDDAPLPVRPPAASGHRSRRFQSSSAQPVV